jgi:serine/threonine-protein kinase
VTRSGLILDDRYRLDERIAAGGVGQVWQATDLLLERAVAVKVLRPEYSDHPETLDRFRKEARNAGALSNPHVAQVYDYGLSGPNGSPYLVMEYVDGPSLADILAVDPIEPVRALDVIAQAAEGLAAAHKAGVIHRDIKPGNILISCEGRVKVTDFGIAHAAGQAPVTGPGLVMGTTQYMAPERIAGNPGSAASDLYALGIVLHECLTGVPPHDGTAAEVMAAHLYLPLPPLPADAPPEIDHLVARLTAKDPAKRISDARELADLAARLRDAMGGTLVPPVGTGGHSGSGAAVSQAAAFAAESASAMAGGSGPASLVSPADGNRQSGPTGSGAGTTALLCPGGNANGPALGSGGNTAVMPPPGDPGGPGYLGYVSDEWNVPARMSLPTGPPQAGQPEQPRRRARTFAVGAAAVASAGLVVLLVSGALNSKPAANQLPAGPSTTPTPTLTRIPSPGASGAARTSGPGSGGIVPGGATTPGTPGSATKRAGKTASANPSGHPSTGSPASPTAGGGASSTPTGGAPSGSPSGSSPTSPSGAPSTPASGAPSPSPTSSSCLLGICF